MPKTVTETITKGLAIDPPLQTPYTNTGNFQMPGAKGPQGAASGGNILVSGITQIAGPAFGSTLTFLLTAIAVFIGTAGVTYLLLRTWRHILKVYSGKQTDLKGTEVEDKSTGLAAARTIMLSHVLTVLVLVLRTRQALGSLAPIAYEVFTLVLGMETAVSVVVGGVWVLVKGLEKGL